MIRLTIPSIEEDDLAAIRQVVSTGYLVQGAQVAAFEQAAAEYIGAEHAVAVSNGTAALHLALLALDVRAGDLVVVTAYSWPATANVIELCGAQPVFVDIEPQTFNMDPDCLASTLRRLAAGSPPGATARRVKAILPVHIFGQLANMPAIGELAAQYDISVVEDAACALGATLHGRQAGRWGTLGCFSFHPRKAITTGEGGLIVTDDAALARTLRALRNHGLDPAAPSSDFVLPGLNYRLTEFQAVFGSSQMRKLERVIAARRRLAERYDSLLRDTPVCPPAVSPGSDPVYQSYVVLLPNPKGCRAEAVAEQRATIIKRLKEQGIETAIGTWHIPLTTYYRTRYGYRPGDFPVTDDVFSRSLTLPLYESLGESDQLRVVAALLECLDLPRFAPSKSRWGGGEGA